MTPANQGNGINVLLRTANTDNVLFGRMKARRERQMEKNPTLSQIVAVAKKQTNKQTYLKIFHCQLCSKVVFIDKNAQVFAYLTMTLDVMTFASYQIESIISLHTNFNSDSI